jgi:hypothetical protein
MDWAHSISDVDGERSVTFNISITGPTSPLFAPMLKRILRRELPSTLSKLIALAEQT